MTTDSHLQRITVGGNSVAGMCTGPDLLIAEAFAQNFDLVMVDLQHGSAGIDRMHALALAIERHGAAVFARVSWNVPQEIMRVLDLGATGVIVPMVESADQAREASLAMRYPPRGNRSFGPMRPGSLLASEANELVQLFPLIETVEGMRRIAEILDVDGVDGVYIGVGDLAISMGLGIGESYRSDRIRAAIAESVARAHERGKLVMTSAPDQEFADGLFEMGADCVIVGLDKAIVYDGIRAVAQPRPAQ